MHAGVLRRSIALAAIGSLAIAGIASADAVRADGDAIAPGIQTTIDVGDVPPGVTIQVPVDFDITCAGTSHPDPGQVITLTKTTTSAAPGGAVLDVTNGVVAPIPSTWTPDGSQCPSPAPHWSDGDFSIVTLLTPSAPNVGYTYTVAYAPSIAPFGNDDANAIRGTAPTITIRLDVVTTVNQAPVLTLPGDQTVEGDATGGWTAAYPGVSATDAEDDPDPTPSCTPVAGSVLPLGTTTVQCSVTDSAGRSASGSFHVSVTDTTAPSLSGVPADRTVTTTDPGGAVVSYASPTATDVVDAHPTVGCLPASGSSFPVGSTIVTCTARDASGNQSTGSFSVTLGYLAPHTASASWMEPVGDGGTFSANHSRTIPVKVRLFVDGVERTSGAAHLTATPCGGGAVALDLVMSFSGHRWHVKLDTSMLPGSCYTIAASIDGLSAGSFVLDLGVDLTAGRNSSKHPTTVAPPRAGPKGR